MKIRKPLSLIAALTCFIMIFAACEPVSGVNLNNVLKSSLDHKSYEGSAKITLELIPGDGPESFGELGDMLAFVESFELDFYEVKKQDPNTASFKGNLNFAFFSIPVALSVTNGQIAIQIEGIERPLVLDPLSSYSDADFDIDAALLAIADVEASKLLFNYVLPNLPNPSKINYTPTTIDLNGEKKNVGKIHAELNGAELLQWLQRALQNLAKDENGLRTFLSNFYDLLKPVLEKSLASIEPEYPEDRFELELVQAYLNNKTLVTEFLFTTITQGYKAALREFADISEEIADDEGLNATTLTADIYVDSSLKVVRSDYELALSMGPDAGGMVINVTSEIWNINGDVEADLIDGTNGINLESYYLGQEILSSVHSNSTIGQLLSAFGYNQTITYIWLDDPGVYVDQGTTFVSLFDIYWYLDIDLDWDSLYEGEIVLYDYTGTTVVLPLGQNKIIVNGEERSIPRGAFEDEYDYYVPLRPVAEAFGYEVIWDAEFQTIDLVKTYF